MPKYMQTHVCGHSGEINIHSKVKSGERIKLLQQMFGQPCSACRVTRKRLSAEEVELMNDAYKLPPLVGTDKQVAWAKSIRLNLYEMLIKEHNVQNCITFYEVCRIMTDSAFWISHRQHNAREFISVARYHIDMSLVNLSAAKRVWQVRAVLRDTLEKGQISIRPLPQGNGFGVYVSELLVGVYDSEEEAYRAQILVNDEIKSLGQIYDYVK